jgi:hypothetical protein
LSDTEPAVPTDPEPDETDVDPDEAERELARGQARRKRRLLDLEKEANLGDTRYYAMGQILDDEVEAVLDGHGVTSQGGSPGIVGEFLLALENFVEKLGGAFFMRELQFANSVHVYLRPEVPEPVRREVQRIIEQDPDRVVTREEVVRLVPESVAAASAAARLLAAPANEALPRARRYGAEVPDAYLRVARMVERTGGTLRYRAPGGRDVALPADRAERIIRSVKEERPPLEPVALRVVGTLTRTDSEEKRFRLVLDRERIPDVLDKRRRVIEGTYTANASKQVRQGGLWDTRVIARVSAYPYEDPLTGARHFERFIFRGVELAG